MGRVTSEERKADVLPGRSPERHAGVATDVLKDALTKLADMHVRPTDARLEAVAFIDTLTAPDDQPALGVFRPRPREAWRASNTFYSTNLYGLDITAPGPSTVRDLMTVICEGCLRLAEDDLEPVERIDLVATTARAARKVLRIMGENPPVPDDTECPVVPAPDFSSVLWYGTKYVFTPLQAKVVALLWNSWGSRVPEKEQKGLLKQAGSDSDQPYMKQLFRGHPALGTMIVEERKGYFRLAGEPPLRCAR